MTRNAWIGTYEHHGRTVSVDLRLKGKHRAHCLCFQGCAKFKPEQRELNCPIAESVFANCKTHGVVSPIWECPEFEAS